MLIKGKAHVFGRDIDTDVIIPARFLTTFDPIELGKHCFEDFDPSFAMKVSKGDILIAGENFGCGSSREHAPLAIKGAGIAAVVASSFARIFLRNSINVGLPVFEVAGIEKEVSTGDILTINTETGEIVDESNGKRFLVAPIPETLQEIIKAGGLVEYARLRSGKK